MRPISFEAHCRRCHNLSFEDARPDRQAPHGVAPREVVEQVKTFYNAQVSEINPGLLRRGVSIRRPVPGRADPPEVVAAGALVDKKVLQALRLLFESGKRSCSNCHTLSPDLPPFAPVKDVEATDVRRANIPPVWFVKARFDHSKHQLMECVDCHDRAPKSESHTDLLLPGKAVCTDCHNAAARPSQVVRAGSGCVECHRYHGGAGRQ
jgi:hypothetical protein